MKSILCILAVALALIAQATPVTPFQAELAARAWTQKNASFTGKDAAVASSAAVAVSNADGVTLWYRVALNNGSCIVVSPVTELEPVIACIENVPEDGLPSGHPMRAMLERDMADRLRKLGLYAPASTGPALMGASPLSATPEDPVMAAWAEEGKAKWARFLGGTGGVQLMAAKEEGIVDIETKIAVVKGFDKGEALTHWNQGNAGGGRCYNFYTPNHAVCGCVATMMSAIMQYFAVTGGPTGVTGVSPATYNDSDTDAGGNPFVTLGGTYDWGCLTNSYKSVKTTRADYNSLTETQRELLGRVAYDAGVAIGMAWTDDESGAITINVAEAFRKVFGFKDARAVSDPTEEQYGKLIYHQCMAGAPVGLSIHTKGQSGGHAVVAVGYGEDENGVPRTRIFTGWGGSGDGWYALPYIKTASVPGGGSHNFDVIAGVITMIGYDSAETVPVVGHVDAPGEAVEVPGAATNTTIFASDLGYFGTRVAPNIDIGSCNLYCRGKEAQFEIGDAAAVTDDEYIVDGEELCTALPEYIEFILLNSSAAYTFAKAKEMALAEGKAILRVSGVTGTEPTTNLLAYIYALDDNNTGDFTNKFVYFFTSAKSPNPELPDGNPSIGVFLPSETEQSGRWQYINGRLAYGYGYARDDEWIESAVNDENVEVTNIVRSVIRNGFRADYGAETNDFRYVDITDGVANDCPYDDFVAALEAMTQFVLDEGWAEFCRRTDGIVLTVTSSAGEIGTPDPAYGVHENRYADGDTVSVVAPGEMVTNETVGVVLGFSGWTLTNETTGAFHKGSGTNATFAVAADDVLTLTWQTVTNAVLIKVCNSDEHMGSTTPGSGWYPYGATSITAKPNADWMFSQWTFCDSSGRSIACPVSKAQSRRQVLSFMATKPMTLFANYTPMSDADAERLAKALATNLTLTVKSAPASIPGAAMPSCTVVVIYTGSSETIAIGESTEVPAVDASVSLSSSVVTDADGATWRCTGWKMGSEVGVGSVAGVSLLEDSELIWLWEKVVPAGTTRRPLVDPDDVPVAADGISSPLTICANSDGTFTVKATIGNAVTGWWYVLKTAGDLAGPYVKAGGDECAKLATADGALELSTTFAPTDEKRFYKVTVEEEAP